jgi:hypothetical protein
LDSICTFEVRAGGYPKKLTCAQALMADTGRTLIDLASAIKTGSVIFHQAMADQCATEALSQPCTQAAYQTLWDDCSLSFEATIAAGGTCHTDFECLAGTTCNGSCDPWDLVICCTGTCATSTPATPVTKVTARDGEACDSVTTCENLTSYCDPTSDTCQPRLGVGSKCGSTPSCMADAVCNGGSCQGRPGLGQNCKLTAGGYVQCLVGGCDQDNVCAATNFVEQCF